MATKVDKKNVIRQGITEAEIVYFQNLAGKNISLQRIYRKCDKKAKTVYWEKRLRKE